MSEVIPTKCFGLLSQKEYEYLNKYFDVVNADAIPGELTEDTKRGDKFMKPKQFYITFCEMREAKNKMWREICNETDDNQKREKLMFARWRGII